ncbi:hypothetical protein DFJ73DRAFT_806149 [Zopfochytrium polystomum]|nr:hypothetical protein DFJ73DRAFT_806149 [Zopfochytrium polystomum]
MLQKRESLQGSLLYERFTEVKDNKEEGKERNEREREPANSLTVNELKLVPTSRWAHHEPTTQLRRLGALRRCSRASPIGASAPLATAARPPTSTPLRRFRRYAPPPSCPYTPPASPPAPYEAPARSDAPTSPPPMYPPPTLPPAFGSAPYPSLGPTYPPLTAPGSLVPAGSLRLPPAPAPLGSKPGSLPPPRPGSAPKPPG